MAAINKIALNSPSRQNPSELENAIAGALFDLESNTQDLKATLRPLQFVSAREVRSARSIWHRTLQRQTLSLVVCGKERYLLRWEGIYGGIKPCVLGASAGGTIQMEDDCVSITGLE